MERTTQDAQDDFEWALQIVRDRFDELRGMYDHCKRLNDAYRCINKKLKKDVSSLSEAFIRKDKMIEKLMNSYKKCLKDNHIKWAGTLFIEAWLELHPETPENK